MAELSAHIEKLQHELERAGQTQAHLKQRATELAQNKEALDAEYNNFKSQHRGDSKAHASDLSAREELVNRVRSLVASKLAVMRERDEYAAQVVAQTGLGGGGGAQSATSVAQAREEGRAIEALILGAGSSLGRMGGPADIVGTGEAERLRGELTQELRRVRAQLEALQRENVRQAASHATFAHEHRRRLEEVRTELDDNGGG